ncbi:hypothetical protein Lesp02_30020 [Lentzea sp. NBRC 105346]|uniref:HD domain-containing protein n=1 Tax=Lentzea sp. NBRC 105346 TaxID=3032205 RepID=UPI0024A05E1B|nr:hypothetical protein [Lentzea sp. NBRC 105346]GLZ30813.1 hypothetical protein Lesp02_30020 [Lentzea sp. NBRC 105346]
MREEWLAAGGSEDGADELEQRYAEPHRKYHNADHVNAVLRDVTLLVEDLGLGIVDFAVLVLAACAHDVIYDGKPGDDERASAAWAREHVPAWAADRVEHIVLATITHSSEDPVAQAFLDADLAILAADRDEYDRYASAVREEYSMYDDEAWRTGRGNVLRRLLARDPIYQTEAARTRWEQRARANLERELRSCTASG